MTARDGTAHGDHPLVIAARRLAADVLAPAAEAADREGVTPETIAAVKASGVLGVGAFFAAAVGWGSSVRAQRLLVGSLKPLTLRTLFDSGVFPRARRHAATYWRRLRLAPTWGLRPVGADATARWRFANFYEMWGVRRGGTLSLPRG